MPSSPHCPTKDGPAPCCPGNAAEAHGLLPSPLLPIILDFLRQQSTTPTSHFLLPYSIPIGKSRKSLPKSKIFQKMLSPTCAMPISICGTAATSNCYSPLPFVCTTTSFPSAQLQQQQMPQHALHLSPCWPSPSFGELPPWMALEAANCQPPVPNFGTLFAHLPHSAHPLSVGNETNSSAFRQKEANNVHLRKTPSSGENSRK